MKIKLLGTGIALLFSCFLVFQGIFGFQKTEVTSIIPSPHSELSESQKTSYDFGLIQRQVEFGENYDEVRKTLEGINSNFLESYDNQTNHWIRLALFFSFKFSFKDLPVLYHNLRI